jgi:hypothetical protein
MNPSAVARQVERPLLSVDHEVTRHRLLDGEIGWPGALEDFVYRIGGATANRGRPRVVGQEAAVGHPIPTRHGID